MKQEKEEIQKDKQDLQEKLKFQDKELKDALAQKKLAMTEYTEVSDKLAELRQQKQKFSRQVGNINYLNVKLLYKFMIIFILTIMIHIIAS